VETRLGPSRLIAANDAGGFFVTKETGGAFAMGSNFRIATEIKTDQASWGHSRWVSNPASTSARQLTFLDAMLAPGQAHSFHRHPSREEVMYVVAGNVEQWIDRKKRVLGAGDAAFIPAGMVHATFNTGMTDAHLLVVFSPCVGDGFEVIDVSSDVPWKGLRELV
jgi:quercetin dioxygenase-like cupin family protein